MDCPTLDFFGEEQIEPKALAVAFRLETHVVEAIAIDGKPITEYKTVAVPCVVEAEEEYDFGSDEDVPF